MDMEGSLAGKLLIAMPNLGDPFEHAVILLCLHTQDQAMGLIINKPNGGLRLAEVLAHLNIRTTRSLGPRKVLYGGPVKPDRGYVLHSEDFYVNEATQRVAPGIGLTATRDVLEAMGGSTPPEHFVLALGYSGWGAGQLESELAQNAWLIADPDNAIVFDEDFEQKWARAIRRLGVEPSQIMGEAGRA
jgi:putative transcriptional regulator